MTNCIKPIGYVLTETGRHPVACKMRNCIACSKVLRNQLMDRVKLFMADDDCRFITLTMQADDRSNIMKHWNVLNLDLKRIYPGIRGFWVKEYTKKGVAHLHILVNRYIDQAWLSRRWYEITGTSYIVYATETHDVHNPAGYMLKYMTKAHTGLHNYNKGERLYGFFGAKAPKVTKLGFKAEVIDFELDQHINSQSKYYWEWLTALQDYAMNYKL